MGDVLFDWLGTGIVALPFLLFSYLSVRLFAGNPPTEEEVGKAVLTTISACLAAAAVAASWLPFSASGGKHIHWATWASVPGLDYHFHFALQFDGLSTPFMILSLVLCGTIARFAIRYLHREPGFHRFFVLYAAFVLGMMLTSVSGNIETMFVGWELVGLSSALLVAFFHERVGPARNGLRVWSVYRIADACFLLAALSIHHLPGAGDFSRSSEEPLWPAPPADIDAWQAFGIGLLLLVAAAGKSALVPFCGWLPRAMEGPTPSSAVFYGALSVHLGAFLLLRFSSLIERSPLLCAIIVVVGLATAVFAAMAASVQTDIKSSLSFAALVQVGLIVAEIGLGLRWIALIHLIGHACLRTLQFVRAPTLLHDYHLLENAIGDHLPRRTPVADRLFGTSWRTRAYRWALERGNLDARIDGFVVRPFVSVFQAADRIERRIADAVNGSPREVKE
jgi:NADH-quinone oxidoreductase subunit L